MKTSPKNAEVLAICLRLFQRNERHEEALEISARIQKLDKDADKKFDLCLIDGISFTKLHLWQQAIDRYESCLSNVKQSEKSLILGNLAEIYMVTQQLEKSNQRYEEARKMQEANVHAIFGQVIVLMRLGEVEKARALFLEGSKYDPGLKFLQEAFFEPQGESDYHLAVFSWFSSRVEEARYYLKRYLDVEQREKYASKGRELLKKLETHSPPLLSYYPIVLERITSIALAPSQAYFAVGTNRGEIYYVDTKTQVVTTLQKEGLAIIGMAFQGNTLRALTKTKAYECDLSKKPLAVYSYSLGENEALGMMSDAKRVLLTDGASLLVSDFENLIKTRVLVDEAPLDEVAAFSNDEKMLLFNAYSTGMYEISTAKRVDKLPVLWAARGVSAHPSRQLFALAGKDAIFFINAEGDVIQKISQDDNEIPPVLSFDSSGKYLIVGNDTLAEIWSLESLNLLP